MIHELTAIPFFKYNITDNSDWVQDYYSQGPGSIPTRALNSQERSV
jgi:hypothetical protein